MNPCAGQFSSLADLIPVVQMLLDPSRPNSVITRYARDKWLHAVHDFEEDNWTELGWPWEIIKAPDVNGRLRKIYWKRTPLLLVAFHHFISNLARSWRHGWLSRRFGHSPRDVLRCYCALQRALS